MSVGLTTASACCDDRLKVHSEIFPGAAFALRAYGARVLLPKMSAVPAGCRRADRYSARKRDRFLRPRVLLRTSVRMAIRPQLLYQQCQPSKSLLWSLVSLRRLSFTPARFLLSLGSRKRYCHALYVSAVPVGVLHSGVVRVFRAIPASTVDTFHTSLHGGIHRDFHAVSS